MNTYQSPKYTCETRIIEIQNNGQKIHGYALIPNTGTTKHPLVIVSHGLGANLEANSGFFEAIASFGFAIYTFDFRGGGGSTSEGDTRQMSVMTEVSDLEHILASAKSWDFVDPDRILLFGHSQGGLVSAITAARHSDEIQALMLIAPGFCIPDDVSKTQNYLIESGKTEFTWHRITLGMPYANDIKDYPPYSELDAIHNPVLLIHATDDPIVPVQYSRNALPHFANVEYHEINVRQHKLTGDALNEALEYIALFLEKTGLYPRT